MEGTSECTKTHHGQRMGLEHRLLVLPLGRDERGDEPLLGREHEPLAPRRAQRPPVERDGVPAVLLFDAHVLPESL